MEQYSWFSCAPQSPLKMPLFWLQKWIQLSHFSQVANFWFSSHNSGEIAVIQKFQYFRNYSSFVWGNRVGWHTPSAKVKLAEIGWNFTETQRKEYTRLQGSLFQLISRYSPEIQVLILYHRNPIQTLISHPIAWASCSVICSSFAIFRLLTIN